MLILKIACWLLVTVLCGIAYRMGGANPPFKSWMRDWIISPLIAIYLWLMGGWNAWVLLTILLCGGALSTYWGKKGSTKTFLNYYLHGLFICLSVLPYTISTGHWIGFAIRTIIMPLIMAWYSVKVSNVVAEEVGRGVAIGITLPLLLL